MIFNHNANDVRIQIESVCCINGNFVDTNKVLEPGQVPYFLIKISSNNNRRFSFIITNCEDFWHYAIKLEFEKAPARLTDRFKPTQMEREIIKNAILKYMVQY